jgi:hypothetical protein
VPHSTAVPSTCHPERPKKTSDGRCDSCYQRDRYQSDPAVKARKLAANARLTERKRGKLSLVDCNDCGQQYQPKTRDKQHPTCHDCRALHGGRPLLGVRQCAWCNEPFKYREHHVRYCSQACSKHSLTEGKSRPIQWWQCKNCQAWLTQRSKHHCPNPPPPPKPRPCATCGEGITVGRFYRYCSQHCSDVAYGKDRQAVYFIDCHWCGTLFSSRQEFAGYCSNLCRKNSGTRAPIGEQVRQAVYERDRWICQLCRRKVGRSFPPRHSRAPSIDHIIPFSLGGSDDPSNLQLAHHGCNSRKQAGVARNGEQLLLLG